MVELKSQVQITKKLRGGGATRGIRGQRAAKKVGLGLDRMNVVVKTGTYVLLERDDK